MIATQFLLLFLSSFSSFQFDFEGGDIEDHIDQKVLYLRQFSDDERKEFCKNGDYLSCKILFLKSINSEDFKLDEIETYFNSMPDEEKYIGIYLYINDKWKNITIDKLKIYMAALPEDLSKRLLTIYLKKLYFSGDVKSFLDEYIQTGNAELTTYYVNELLKINPAKALEYLRSLKISFPENFYDSMSKNIENYSSKLKGDSFNEFRIWNLEFNYRKIRYKQAVNLALNWFPSKKYSDSYTWRAHLYRAMSHTKKREHKEAQAIYKKLEEHCLNEKLSPSDLFKFFHEYSYSEAALSNNDKSIELYLTAYEYFLTKDEESAASFLYMAADMSRLAEYWQKAEELYQQYIKNYPHSSQNNVAKFLLFWINYKQRDFHQSKKILDDIMGESYTLSYDYQRAAYWLSRVQYKLEDFGKSLSLICFLSENFPASFYGSMAASRIREEKLLCKNNELSISNEIQYNKFRDENMMPETNWIIAAMIIDNDSIIRKTLNATSKTIGERGDEIDRLTVSYCAKKTNNHSLSARMLKSISNLSGTSKEYFKLQYTVAFEEEILSHCDFYDVPPMFVFSIARQESLFNIGAVSSSFAIGLLQLLPSTAQLLANKENYGKITPEILKKPLTNVRFGTRFLSDLLEKFNGSIPLAAASYNAGPGRISKWMVKDGNMEIDEFIEDIPIFQTRNYVKKVMTNYAVYHYIFEDKVYDGLEFKLLKK